MSISDAIIYKSVAEVRNLLTRELNINYVDEYGFTPLIQTAIMNNIDKGELIIDHGADVNFRDLTGGSALHWTTENNNLPFCRLLIDHGADPNAYTLVSEPVLSKAILRGQRSLRRLLIQAGANLNFAQDYINTKLLAHRFELVGYADIINHQNRFTEVDFEGFSLEFTIGIILQSLEEYQNNFSARHLRHYFDLLNKLIATFSVATQLIRFQQYQVDLEAHRITIDNLLNQEMLMIPVAYEGHAISFIKYRNYLAKCDRSQNDLFIDNVVIYEITRPQVLSKELIKSLMYKRQTKNFIDVELSHLLGLKPVNKLVIGAQISGNCSWANIEACIPVMFFLFSLPLQNTKNIISSSKDALAFYYQWLEWDKNRALHFCIQSFPHADPARKASQLAILAAILFQRCNANVALDVERARKVVPLLKTPGYEYILNSYIEIYYHHNATKSGENLRQLLRICEI